MRIYCVRDRLVNYYMRPFFLEDDKAAMAAIAQIVNGGDPNNAVAQAPHQFEIWRLGEINETGDVKPEKEYLGDASGLIREGIRDLTHRIPGSLPRAITPDRSTGAPGGDREGTRTLPSAPPHKARTAPRKANKARKRPGGVPRGLLSRTTRLSQ